MNYIELDKELPAPEKPKKEKTTNRKAAALKKAKAEKAAKAESKAEEKVDEKPVVEEKEETKETKAEEKVTLDKELAKKWLSNGAQPTDTVRSILSHEGVLKEMHEAKSSK